jgi:hypothetical protein
MEVRSYEEAIGEPFRSLRPHLEVAIVDPEAVQEKLVRFEPTLVFGDRADTLSSTGSPG